MNGTALLLSIKPRYADAIFAHKKTVELRRVRPRVGSGDLVLIYVSSPRCSLEGAFEVDEVLEGKPKTLWKRIAASAGVTRDEYLDYFGERETAFAIVIRKVWHLAPVSLSDLRKADIRPPQSYQYLDRLTATRLALPAVRSRRGRKQVCL